MEKPYLNLYSFFYRIITWNYVQKGLVKHLFFTKKLLIIKICYISKSILQQVSTSINCLRNLNNTSTFFHHPTCQLMLRSTNPVQCARSQLLILGIGHRPAVGPTCMPATWSRQPTGCRRRDRNRRRKPRMPPRNNLRVPAHSGSEYPQNMPSN